MREEVVQPVNVPASGWKSTFEKRWVPILALGCLLTGLIGFLVGVNRSNVTIRSCSAYAAPTQATATCGDGWAYAIPVDGVKWRDASGVWHDAGRPDCLPPGPQGVNRITFATVDAKVNGVAWRPVVWVSC
jgi:hypothetical protein